MHASSSIIKDFCNEHKLALPSGISVQVLSLSALGRYSLAAHFAELVQPIKQWFLERKYVGICRDCSKLWVIHLNRSHSHRVCCTKCGNARSRFLKAKRDARCK